MKALQTTLAILAAVCLLAQTVRHAYILWFEPRVSVMDKYDQPLKEEIAAATSLEELLRRYEPVRKEVDRIKAQRRAIDPNATFHNERDEEPFKSEDSLREAISSWEDKQKEIRALRFYWFVGLVFAALGLLCCTRWNEWLGVTLLIAGFAEFIYWTSPSFFGTATQEFDRLLLNKLLFSLASLLLLAVATFALGAFRPARSGGE